MLKDNIRDYATEAFRLYARLDRPTYDVLRERVYDYALGIERKREVSSKGLSKPTEQAIINAQCMLAEFEAKLLDILAVESTLRILSLRENGQAIKRAVEIVYFTEPDRDIRRNEITERSIYAALIIHADERTVYRYLKQARAIFAQERGLRDRKVVSSGFKLCDIIVL